MLPDDFLKLAFDLSVEIAHKVAGFELHFRKTPDQWGLIDKQFPN